MARGAYKESAAVAELRGLIAFAEGEGDLPPSKYDRLDPATWRRVAALMVTARPTDEQTHALAARLIAGPPRPSKLPLERVRPDLRRFFRVLARLNVGGLNEGYTNGSDELAIMVLAVSKLPLFSADGRLLTTEGRPEFLVLGSFEAILRDRAWKCLAAVGLDRLLLCPAPDCGRAFLKVGRRAYCSERCQRRVFLSNYNAFAPVTPRKAHKHVQTTKPKKRRPATRPTARARRGQR